MTTPSRKKRKKNAFLKGIERKKKKTNQVVDEKPTDTEAGNGEAEKPGAANEEIPPKKPSDYERESGNGESEKPGAANEEIQHEKSIDDERESGKGEAEKPGASNEEKEPKKHSDQLDQLFDKSSTISHGSLRRESLNSYFSSQIKRCSSLSLPSTSHPSSKCKKKRESETLAQMKIRMEKDRLRHQKQRKNESAIARKIRLSQMAAHAKEKRAEEVEQEKEIRLSKMAADAKEKRAEQKRTLENLKSEFPPVISEEIKRKCLSDFIEATSFSKLPVHICAVCAVALCQL